MLLTDGQLRLRATGGLLEVQNFRLAEVDRSLKDEDPLAHSRVVSAVEHQLTGKGFRRVDSTPDVYVTYHGENDERMTLNTTTMGYGYGEAFY